MRGIHGIVRLESRTIGVQHYVTMFVLPALMFHVMISYDVVSCSRYFYVAHGTGLEMMLHGALVSSSMSIWTAILFLSFWGTVGTVLDTYSGHHSVSRADIWRARAPSEVVDSARKHPFILLPLCAFRRGTWTSYEIRFFWMDAHATMCTSCL